MENKAIFEKEKEKLKKKNTDQESKVRDSENRRTTNMFEHEKDRTKWNLEKEHLINAKNDILERVDKTEKKREALLRENEKARNEIKKLKRMLGHMPTGQNPIVGGGYTNTYGNYSKYESSYLKNDKRMATLSDNKDN